MAARESVRPGRLLWMMWVADGAREDLRWRKGGRGVYGWTVTSDCDPYTERS